MKKQCLINKVVAEFAQSWRESGVTPGDVLLVHSSLKRTLMKGRRQVNDYSVHDVVRSFLHAIGPEGTLLLPLFNFDFTKGIPFDMRTTPSQMGALTEVGRQWPGSVRTGHPIYSFAVIGAEAERFHGLANYSGYDEDSPFALLRELDGKVASLDLPDQDSITFYHHVEEMHKVSYRYYKSWEGDYTDEEGVTTRRTFGLFVRDIENGVLTAVDPMGERLWQRGLYKGSRPGEGSGLRVIRARDLYDATAEVILSGQAEGLLYKAQK